VIQHPSYVEVVFIDRPNVEPAKIMSLKENFPTRVNVYPEGIRLKTLQLGSSSLLTWLVKVFTKLI
jgi:transcription-repair coupling factor (superfamily II helicase)